MISFCACLGWDMHNLEGVRAIRGKEGGRDMRFQGRDAARGRRMRKDLGRTAGAGVALALVLFLMPALLVPAGGIFPGASAPGNTASPSDAVQRLDRQPGPGAGSAAEPIGRDSGGADHGGVPVGGGGSGDARFL